MAKGEQRTAVQIMQDAQKVHPWPNEIRLHQDAIRCLSIYEKYQFNRPHDGWFPGDLLDLAQMAKMTVEVEEELQELASEGNIVLGGKSGNTEIANPRLRVISELQSMKSTTARRLNLAGRHKGNEDRKTDDASAAAENSARSAVKKTKKQRASMI